MTDEEKTLTFQIGDKIIHPIYGFGVIEDYKKIKVMDEEQGFYVLYINNEKLSLMISEKDVARGVSVRKPSSPELAAKALEILKKHPKRIEEEHISLKEYIEKLKKGNIINLAEFIRDISFAESYTELDMDLKKLLRKSKKILIEELSISLKQKEYQITRELNKLLKPPLPLQKKSKKT